MTQSEAEEALEIVSRIGSAIGLLFGGAKLELVKNCNLTSGKADKLLLESIAGMMSDLKDLSATVDHKGV